MNTKSTDDPADEELRDLLAQADPEAGSPPAATDHLLDRVRDDIADAEPSEPSAQQGPSWWSRHWQGSLLAVAAVAALAIAAPTALPGLTNGGSDADQTIASKALDEATGDAATAEDLAAEDPAAEDLAAAPAPEQALRSGEADTSARTSLPTANGIDPALVRSASMLVGTEDIPGERDSFVAAIQRLGGRVTSETVVSEGQESGGLDRAAGSVGIEDIAVSSPYPWYPTGPGVWLTVQVPVDEYDQALDRARGTGEVVQMQQSSYDASTQIADVDARVAALETSLARLTDLLGSADNVTDVIALEQAISTRQAQLDSLRAQQRNLANQTEMSSISLTLMSPEDARGTVDPNPDPDQNWWESFVAGLGAFWSWLGTALLIVSPLLIAMAIIWWVRRRLNSSPPEPDAGA